MKRKINLFLRQKKYQQIGSKIERFKKGLLAAVFIAFLLVMVSFTGSVYLGKKFESLLLQKKALLSFIVDNKKEEAEYIYFSSKERQIRDIVNNDLNYAPYYEFLRSAVSAASDEAFLESLAVNKDRNVSFTLSLPDYSSLLLFLSRIESDTFLSHFKTLSLIHLSALAQNYQSYKLEFKGQFTKPNEN